MFKKFHSHEPVQHYYALYVAVGVITNSLFVHLHYILSVIAQPTIKNGSYDDV